jgi:hypothetical protein
VALDPEELALAGSAEWWLVRLGQRLDAERAEMNRLNDYDKGLHPFPTGNKRSRETFTRFQRQARTNFVGLVTESVLDRLRIDGFRMGGQGDVSADALAHDVWQDNGLDADAGIVMRDALVMRRAYVVVGPTDDADSKTGVLVTGEDPRQVMHECDPCNRRKVRAALKTWSDDVTGEVNAVVYLPETITYFTGIKREGGTPWDAAHWERDLDEGTDGVEANPTAPVVPVVPFVNRPEKARCGFGEFEDLIDIQDRINQGTLDRMVTGATQSFRQRWATGVDIDKNQFDPGADLIWHVEDAAAKFGDFTNADIRMFLDGVRADVEAMASISRTPPYYLLGQMVNVSGDALTAAESGLVAKCRSRMLQFGESWEAVEALAFMLKGRKVAIDAEVIWADPERRNEAASADAAVKKATTGVEVPKRQLWEDLGYSPQQIERMEAMLANDAFEAMLKMPPQLQPQLGPDGQPMPMPGAAPPAPSGAASAGAAPKAPGAAPAPPAPVPAHA